MLQPSKHNVAWAFLAKRRRISNSLVQRFLWKNRKSRIFEALFQQDNDIVQMRDMAHSICLIKLYQITMRKKFRFLVSDHLDGKFTATKQIPNIVNGGLTIKYCYGGDRDTVSGLHKLLKHKGCSCRDPTQRFSSNSVKQLLVTIIIIERLKRIHRFHRLKIGSIFKGLKGRIINFPGFFFFVIYDFLFLSISKIYITSK